MARLHRRQPGAKFGHILEPGALRLSLCHILGCHIVDRLDRQQPYLGLERAACLDRRSAPAAKDQIDLARLDLFEQRSLEQHQPSTAVASISTFSPLASNSLTTTVARTGKGCWKNSA